MLATMFTMTTYGTWLRGDSRGWVEEGIIRPPMPALAAADRERLKHAPYRFESTELASVGRWIGEALVQRLNQQVLALTVQAWHVHVVVSASDAPLGSIVKCAKDAARWGLRPKQPIWSAGYDKRFCFDERSVRQRIEYVERHNVELGMSPRPWEFLDHPF
jgi:hypothetical protein